MQLKYLDATKIKSLEDYIFVLCLAILQLETMALYHEEAINEGILKEDQISRANTILWDLRKRLIQLYFDQAASIAELLPDDFNVKNTMAKIKANEILAAKKLTRKPKKNDGCSKTT